MSIVYIDRKRISELDRERISELDRAEEIIQNTKQSFSKKRERE